MKKVLASSLAVSILASFSVASVSSAFPQNATQGAPQSAPAQSAVITGKVVETMDSAGYTYVCLEKDGKKTWVAVPQMKVKKGQTMSFKPGMEMVNFESKTLKRKFDKVIFSEGPVKK